MLCFFRRRLASHAIPQNRLYDYSWSIISNRYLKKGLNCWSAGEFAVFKNGQKIETVNEAMKMKGVGQ